MNIFFYLFLRVLLKKQDSDRLKRLKIWRYSLGRNLKLTLYKVEYLLLSVFFSFLFSEGLDFWFTPFCEMWLFQSLFIFFWCSFFNVSFLQHLQSFPFLLGTYSIIASPLYILELYCRIVDYVYHTILLRCFWNYILFCFKSWLSLFFCRIFIGSSISTWAKKSFTRSNH